MDASEASEQLRTGCGDDRRGLVGSNVVSKAPVFTLCQPPSSISFSSGFFFKTFFAALEGKLNGAEFINFASAWSNFDAFGMFHPGMQACRPALPSVQVTVSLRSYHRWGIYTCCWDPECSAIYCFPGVWLVLPLLAEVVWGGGGGGF